MKIQRIAVTTDFSEFSRRTFPVAASLARKFSAQLSVFHQAVLALLVPEPVPDTEEMFAALEKSLSRLVSSDPALQEVKAVPVMIRGGNHRTFGERLDQENVDLVVIAAHGRSGLERFLLGSFTENLLRFASCPVLVYRDSGKEPELRGDFSPRRILVPHDFSEPSTRTLELAREWVQGFAASARLLSVVDTERGVTGFQADLLGGWDAYYEQVTEVATRELDKVLRDWRGLEAQTVVTRGHPAGEILSQAEDFRADLIIMGSHGSSYLQRLLLGGIAEQIVRRAEAPVLLVRSPPPEGSSA